MRAEPPKLVFITSVGHSGSTLLDMLLSAHPEVVSVGEIDQLERLLEKKCTCGAKMIPDCPFWREIEAVLQRDAGLKLDALDLRSEDDETFRNHNRALFGAVSSVTGCAAIVDSSKRPDRLARLIRSKAFDVLPIHLVRRPEGVVYSNVRKGRHWKKHAFKYNRQVLRTLRLLRPIDSAFLRYEDLVAGPEQTLRNLMPRLGLAFTPEQLRWARNPRHNVGGNRMRRSDDDTIRLDTRWQKELSSARKAVISLIALPSRLALKSVPVKCRVRP